MDTRATFRNAPSRRRRPKASDELTPRSLAVSNRQRLIMQNPPPQITSGAPVRARRGNEARYRLSGPLAATTALLGVVALLLGIAQSYLAVVMIASVIVFVGSFHYVLGSGRAFAFALANLIASYACVFLFFVESNF